MNKIKNFAIPVFLILCVLFICAWIFRYQATADFINWYQWGKPNITRFTGLVLSYIDVIWQLGYHIWNRISDRYEWIKLIITTFVGGLLSYFCVIYRENKKELRAIREQCTTALLNIQMIIILQMDELKGLEEICLSIIKFKLFEKSLAHYFDSIDDISAKSAKLKELCAHHGMIPKDLLELTNHLVITPPINTIIVLPQEIFKLPFLKRHGGNLKVPELASYFKELETCNRGYMQIISLIKHRNEIRNIVVINQPIFQQVGSQEIFIIVAAMYDLAIKLYEQIKCYLEKTDFAFTKTGSYIALLDIAPSIQVARDKNGRMIFDRLNQ